MQPNYEQMKQSIEAKRGMYQIFRSYESGCELILALRELGLAYDRNGEPRVGMNYIMEAKEIAAELLSRGEKRAEKDLVRITNDAAAIYMGAGALGGAQTSLEEAASHAEAWVAREETLDSLEALCTTYDNRGHLSMRAGYPYDALDHFAKAEEAAFRRLGLDKESHDNFLNYSVILCHLAEAKQAARDIDGALQDFENAFSALDTAADAPVAHRRAAVGVCRRIAAILQSRGQHGEAASRLQTAVNLADGVIVEDDSTEALREATLSYFALGRLKDAEGSGLESRMFLMKAVSFARQNADRHGTPTAKDDLAVALCTWGELFRDRASVEDAIAVWSALSEQYPQNRAYQQKMGYAQNVLARLG